MREFNANKLCAVQPARQHQEAGQPGNILLLFCRVDCCFYSVNMAYFGSGPGNVSVVTSNSTVPLLLVCNTNDTLIWHPSSFLVTTPGSTASVANLFDVTPSEGGQSVYVLQVQTAASYVVSLAATADCYHVAHETGRRLRLKCVMQGTVQVGLVSQSVQTSTDMQLPVQASPLAYLRQQAVSPVQTTATDFCQQ